jgi:hypothetical protein
MVGNYLPSPPGPPAQIKLAFPTGFLVIGDHLRVNEPLLLQNHSISLIFNLLKRSVFFLLTTRLNIQNFYMVLALR